MARNIESEHGRALISWHNHKIIRLPELAMLFHVPNGGARTRLQGSLLKAEGVKAGVVDYLLPVRRYQWSGLAFELKAPRNYPTADQRWWMHNLTNQGWLCFCAWHWHSAAEVLAGYLEDGFEYQEYGHGDWLIPGAGKGAKVYSEL